VLAPDVNVLVYAHRAESPDHARYGAWLERLAEGIEPFGLPDLVGAAFVRIVTNARLWRQPTSPRRAVEFVERLRSRRACRVLHAGAESWPIFARLVDATSATGKLVADAWLAALVMEHACTLATCDGDFARFSELRWMHPLQSAE
jgi:toxin-antitoxin system PIN domain toxin